MNRGGSWNNSPANCRSANRNANDPSNANDNLGFRPVLAPSSPRRPEARGRTRVGVLVRVLPAPKIVAAPPGW